LAITESPFQLIVCDIGMPGTDGYTLLRDLRRSPTTAHIPAIALTAFARPEDQRAAMEAGFNVHLAKPVSPATIIETCFRLVAA
jgi:CheY-like chemotaxis protein